MDEYWVKANPQNFAHTYTLKAINRMYLHAGADSVAAVLMQHY